jgi:DNA invertase Pin-like site-specific DNA recombinase
MKVVMYRRVSTSTQVDGFGLDTQKSSIEEYCKKNNIEIVGDCIDSGVSGTSNDRDGLLEALTFIEEGKAQKIIVRDIGRLWRDIYQQAYVMGKLKDFNADFISIEDPNLNMHALENDPSQYLVNTILQALANHQRMEIKRKLAKGRTTKAQQGSKACGVAPMGYKWNSKAEIVIDTDRAEIVRDIYKLYNNGTSLQKIADSLNDKGITTDRGKMFSKQAISVILKNDFYCGVVAHGTIKQQGNHEPIISKVLFGRIQSKMKKNRKH